MNFQFSIFNRKNCGFTLIEMMVVFLIILILTAISIPIYQGSKKELALQRATNKLAGDIRRAQEMAMAAKEFRGTIPKGGYGIHFNLDLDLRTSYYILFADDDEDRSLSPEEKVEKIEIEPRVEITGLFPLSPLDITFIPPDPTTLINGGADPATIVLQIDNSTTSVKVLPSGLIYIK